MANPISLRGFVSSELETKTLDTGLVVGNFRMGSNIRRIDPITNQWVDGKTNWFRVNTFRALASNSIASIHKGDRILVIGKLRVTSFLRKDGTPGTGVEIDADSIGPDLQFGTTSYHRLKSARPAGQGDSLRDGGSLYLADPVPNDPIDPGDSENYTGESGESNADEQDGDSGDDDAEAAARAGDSERFPHSIDRSSDGGLDLDDVVDEETGEINKVADPY